MVVKSAVRVQCGRFAHHFTVKCHFLSDKAEDILISQSTLKSFGDACCTGSFILSFKVYIFSIIYLFADKVRKYSFLQSSLCNLLLRCDTVFDHADKTCHCTSRIESASQLFSSDRNCTLESSFSVKISRLSFRRVELEKVLDVSGNVLVIVQNAVAVGVLCEIPFGVIGEVSHINSYLFKHASKLKRVSPNTKICCTVNTVNENGTSYLVNDLSGIVFKIAVKGGRAGDNATGVNYVS